MTEEEAFEVWFQNSNLAADQKEVCRQAFVIGYRWHSIRINAHRWADEKWLKICKGNKNEEEEVKDS